MTDKSKNTNQPSQKPANNKGPSDFVETVTGKVPGRRDAVIDHIPPPKIPPKK
ncbi:MAG: hypothetical protein JRD89_04545 [Deltaproteobacteria bacterium]|nr:hypothetical protein [Deltaproteobacteria bacterium]